MLDMWFETLFGKPVLYGLYCVPGQPKFGQLHEQARFESEEMARRCFPGVRWGQWQ